MNAYVEERKLEGGKNTLLTMGSVPAEKASRKLSALTGKNWWARRGAKPSEDSCFTRDSEKSVTEGVSTAPQLCEEKPKFGGLKRKEKDALRRSSRKSGVKGKTERDQHGGEGIERRAEKPILRGSEKKKRRTQFWDHHFGGERAVAQRLGGPRESPPQLGKSRARKGSRQSTGRLPTLLQIEKKKER